MYLPHCSEVCHVYTTLNITLNAISHYLLLTGLIFGDIAEDVEVDVESIVFDCVDSDGLNITHTDADHCYSSMDKAWL